MFITRCGAALLALTAIANAVLAQVQIYELPAPASHERAGTPGASATSVSPSTGREGVVVELDDTGITDWSYLNPRRPVRVPAGADVTFANMTADRAFEITTTLSFKAGDIPASGLPLTVPLLIYDAMTPETTQTIEALARRWGLSEEEVRALTVEDIEIRRLVEVKKIDPGFAETFDHVRWVEEVLRIRAKKRTAETEARSALAKLSPTAKLEETTKAQDLVRTATAERMEADKEVACITGVATESDAADDLASVRKALIDAFAARAAEKRKERGRIPVTPDPLDRQIALLDLAGDALKNQSDDTAFLAPFRLAMTGAFDERTVQAVQNPFSRTVTDVLLEDCTVTAAAATCTAAARVYPYGFATFPHRVLELQPEGSALARFTVRFFEEEETPARQTAYVISASNVARIAPPKTAATLQAVASVGAAFDPFIEDRSAKSRNCPFLCPDKPFTGARRTHYTGTGRVEITQTFGNLLDGKVSLGYKEGDLGGGPAGTDVKLSQYRFNLYSEPGVTFHYGKFPFAAPSSGIAINESGEGFRLAFRNLALSHITKRESATSAADASNRDNEVSIAEAVNMPLPKKIREQFPRQPIRTISLIYLTGNDRKGPEDKVDTATGIKEKLFSEHSYTTYGGQVGFTLPQLFYGTASMYRSRREADEDNAPCNDAAHVCDGSGEVGLFTVTRPFARDDKGKFKRTITLSLGFGSGDDPSTAAEDEGYIGETAGYAPDLIFLSSIAANVSTADFLDLDKDFTDKSEPFDDFRDKVLKRQFRDLDRGAIGIGRGLANKRYAGLKYVDNSMSLLAWIATHLPYLKIPEGDIRSRATFFTLNEYRLRHPISGSRNAGRELDVEFLVETPRSVKVSLKLGHFWRGSALETIVKKNVWTAAANISISL